MESIIQKEKQCLVCGTTYNLHLHHCLHGTANRKLADKYGLTVFLCAYHHNMSDDGVHFNKDFDTYLKKLAQVHFEKTLGNREEFRKIFGRSYL